MYTIIPLTQERIHDIATTEILDTTIAAIAGVELIGKLLMIDEFPIANKKIAISNILQLLKYIDVRLNESDDTLLTINTSVFIRIFNNNRYKEYLDLLTELNVITRVPYNDGTFYNYDGDNKYAAQYRVHNNYLQDDLCLIIMDRHNEITLRTDNKYPVKLEKTIKNIDVDYNAAILAEFEYNNTKQLSKNNLRIRINKLLSLAGERYITKGHKVDRIYHSLSNLSKVSRKFLNVKGVEFNDVDIKNCQPLLLCYLIKTLGMNIDDNYQYDCEIGQIYEHFIFNNTRDEAKVETYKSIYFDFKPESRVAKKFKKLYPLTYASLEIINKDEEKLAAKLQNIEASIFNVLIPKYSKYYYTLFDSIYFTDINDCIVIINQIQDKFKVLGIKPIMTINGSTEFDIIDEEIKMKTTK